MLMNSTLSLQSQLTQYVIRVKTLAPKKAQKYYDQLSQNNWNTQKQIQSNSREEQDDIKITIEKHQTFSIGIECSTTIQTAQEFIKQLLDFGTFLPEYGMTKDQKLEHITLFANLDTLENNRNLGYQWTIVGMTLIGFLGFVIVGFTMFGAIGGGALGIVLGRYGGKKISKKIKKNGLLDEFDVFKIRMQCVMKWAHIQRDKNKFNINQLRFTIERVMLEIKPLLHYKYFDQGKSVRILNKVKKFIAEQDCVMALIVSFKLCKEYVKILDKQIIYSLFSLKDIERVLVSTVQDVLLPLNTLYWDDPKLRKHKVLYSLCYRIQIFMTNRIVLNALPLYPDSQMSIEYIKYFSEKLRNKIKIEDLQDYFQTESYKNMLGIQINVEDGMKNEKQSEMEKLKLDLISPNQRVQSRRNSTGQLRQSGGIQDVIVVNDVASHHRRMSRSQSMLQRSHTVKPAHMQLLQIRGDVEIDELSMKQIAMPKQSQQEIQLQISPQKQNNTTRISNELENKFEMLISILNEQIDGWETVMEKEQIVIYKTMKPGNPAVFVKGHGDIYGVTKEVVYQTLYEEQYRKKWDKLLVNFHIVERESDTVDVVYYYVESPFGVANREFCQKRLTRVGYPKQDQICLIYFSVEHKNAPAPKGHVRCETMISGYVIEDLPNNKGARLYFCSNNDVKGNLLKSIVNFVASRAPISWFTSLRKGCLEYEKYKQTQQQTQQQKKQNKF